MESIASIAFFVGTISSLFIASAIVEQNIDDESRKRELKLSSIIFAIALVVFVFTAF